VIWQRSWPRRWGRVTWRLTVGAVDGGHWTLGVIVSRWPEAREVSLQIGGCAVSLYRQRFPSYGGPPLTFPVRIVHSGLGWTEEYDDGA
jgi:hypothetical protein